MLRFLQKIKGHLWMLRSLFSTLFFNFHYLPFRQAIHLPVVLYKPRLLRCKGKVYIRAERITMGMIQLGRPNVSVFPNSGITFENKGGTITFTGSCVIGNASAISVGPVGQLYFGYNFKATAADKFVAYHNVQFGDSVLCGWDCSFLDTDFHKLSFDDGTKSDAEGDILIGNQCWFAFRCVVLHGTKLPAKSVVASSSLCNKSYLSDGEKCLFAGCPAKMVRRGVYRNPEDD